MLIGTMNHPGKNVLEEIRWMAGLGMEFVDLTLEPPAAGPWQVDPEKIRAELDKHGLKVVGHTAFYLPMANAFPEVRRAAVTELRQCLRVFGVVGARWMNLHPDRYTPFHDRAFFIRRNLETIHELMEDSEKYGVGLMIENLPGDFNSAAQLADLLDPVPELGLHLDFGHANLQTPRNTAGEILARFGDRLRHVHLHDNRGGNDDLHLPLGAGNVDVEGALRSLRDCAYDGTLTLEVFTPDRHYLTYSRDRVRELWGALTLVRE